MSVTGRSIQHAARVNDAGLSLVVFATYGGSFGIWEAAGILDRELALYKEHASHGLDVHVITYGDGTELELANRYDFVRIHCNQWNLHPRMYAAFLPVLHHRVLRSADVYKTNQAYGAHIAHRCATLWRKPLVLRQGYGHYENRAREHGEASIKARRALRYERKYMRAATATILTTRGLADRAIARHGLEPDKTFVVPNYIVNHNWSPPHPNEDRAGKLRLVFVGRLSEEKNLASLIDAAAGLPVVLTIIGHGELADDLRRKACKPGVECYFAGRVRQEELRDRMVDGDVFVLPSLFEGHPKALIEAMALGMPVLGADSPGIRDLVVDGRTGILAQPNAADLREGIERLLAMPLSERRRLASNARAWALSNFSVSAIAERERSILSGVMAEQHG